MLAFLLRLMPYIQLAVHVVEATAPVGTPGEEKKAVATSAINNILAAAVGAGNVLGEARTALTLQDPAAVAQTVSHGIELAVSVAKGFGAFPKAGIVQNAPSVDEVLKRMYEQPPGP